MLYHFTSAACRCFTVSVQFMQTVLDPFLLTALSSSLSLNVHLLVVCFAVDVLTIVIFAKLLQYLQQINFSADIYFCNNSDSNNSSNRSDSNDISYFSDSHVISFMSLLRYLYRKIPIEPTVYWLQQGLIVTVMTVWLGATVATVVTVVTVVINISVMTARQLGTVSKVVTEVTVGKVTVIKSPRRPKAIQLKFHE